MGYELRIVLGWRLLSTPNFSIGENSAGLRCWHAPAGVRDINSQERPVTTLYNSTEQRVPGITWARRHLGVGFTSEQNQGVERC